MLFLTLYLTGPRGMSTPTAGLLAGTVGVGFIVGNFTGGRWGDRYGHRRVLPLDSAQELAGLVRQEARAGDVVVLLGAGDITNWSYALPGELQALGQAAE